MTDGVRVSRVVATDDTTFPMLRKEKTANARMWVYVGDESQPYNVLISLSIAVAMVPGAFCRTTIRCW